MSKYYLSSVKYEKMAENGNTRPVTEQYLFDALSYTEAEARTIEELTPYISGEFSITDIRRPRLAELFLDSMADDRYYKVVVTFITIDEKTAVEKRTKSAVLVQANDFDAAVSAFKEGMKGTLADFEIISVTETPIMGFYPAKLSGDAEV